MLLPCFNMRKTAFIICIAVLISTFGLVASADVSETSVTNAAASTSGSYSTLEIAIVSCLMFTVIAVIGVMFIKIVMKNNNNRR